MDEAVTQICLVPLQVLFCPYPVYVVFFALALASLLVLSDAF
jgi:hypothetical protein